METVPRVTVTCSLLVAVALSGCGKKEQPSGGSTSSAQATGAAASAKAPLPVDPDTLTLQYQLGDMTIPADNPQSKEKIELGHQLFFDKRLSGDGSLACYSCHLNEDGNGGHDPVAIGPGGKKLPRHSPVIWNVGYAKKLYWDGRSATLEEQGLAALAGGNMAVGKDKLEDKAKEIGKIAGYKKAFEAAFPGKGVTAQTIVMALSAYERSLVCDDTAFDKYAKGDKTVLKPEQKRGLVTFTGKGGCTTCHTPPFFSLAFLSPEGAYFNTGIGTQGKSEDQVDGGRKNVTKADTDWAAFKPPSLRNVAASPPYFHDGSVATLKDAVKLMASGGIKNKNLTPLLTDKQLTDAEIDDVVAFLGALNCDKKLEEPKLPK
ncbi:MAG TPA: cytochrome c peroxidase [Polyangiaceae bacterium]|nr:cytochrome c peroxidase [Polyangiaceae bacterium]